MIQKTFVNLQLKLTISLMDYNYTLEYNIFLTLYGGVTLTALIACCYLLFRRANVFAPEINSPKRLRYWTAVFFAFMAVSHLWWLLALPTYLSNDYSLGAVICSGIDILTLLPTILCTMLAMLQDRRRPLWPVAVIVVISLADLFMVGLDVPHASTIHIVLSCIFLFFISTLLVHAVRQYGRWLRDNYADLEHKEVWQSFVVVVLFFLSSLNYSIFTKLLVWETLMQVFDLIIIFTLLWRVETLQTLEEPVDESPETNTFSDPIFNKIELLLQQNCLDTQYYLRHDISLTQLAKHIGTNSTYLSQYFSQCGESYNTYINGLRIEYFIRLYRESVDAKRVFTARQLASESGFRSYSTFSAAFKLIKGEAVTSWMQNNTNQA